MTNLLQLVLKYQRLYSGRLTVQVYQYHLWTFATRYPKHSGNIAGEITPAFSRVSSKWPRFCMHTDLMYIHISVGSSDGKCGKDNHRSNKYQHNAYTFMVSIVSFLLSIKISNKLINDIKWISDDHPKANMKTRLKKNKTEILKASF